MKVKNIRLFFDTSLDVACVVGKDGQVWVDNAELEVVLRDAMTKAATKFFKKDLAVHLTDAVVSYNFDEEIEE